MQVKVLGSLEVFERGQSITPSATKHRQVLTLLAMHAGQVVSVRMLLDEVWGSDLPDTATQTLQTYVLHLRRRIASALGAGKVDAVKKILITRHHGYSLDIDRDDLDAYRYERLASAGRRAMDQGDFESASRLLHSALNLWRGPALVDVQTGPLLTGHMNRLEESRLGALEARIEADLRLGRHHSLLSELAELTARYPMHERLCAQYMIAQYRAGRQWRALESFRRLRGVLVAELGMEPSPQIQDLQRAILNADPDLGPLYANAS